MPSVHVSDLHEIQVYGNTGYCLNTCIVSVKLELVEEEFQYFLAFV